MTVAKFAIVSVRAVIALVVVMLLTADSHWIQNANPPDKLPKSLLLLDAPSVIA
jgi:hypothetical protein